MYINHSQFQKVVGVPQKCNLTLQTTDIMAPPKVTAASTRRDGNNPLINLTVDKMTANCWSTDLGITIGTYKFIVRAYDVPSKTLVVVPALSSANQVYYGETYSNLIGQNVLQTDFPIKNNGSSAKVMTDSQGVPYYVHTIASGQVDTFIWDMSFEPDRTAGFLIQITNVGSGALVSATLDFSLDGVYWAPVPDVTSAGSVAKGSGVTFYTKFNPLKFLLKLTVTGGATDYTVYTAG